jgi:putative acetyltransferase
MRRRWTGADSPSGRPCALDAAEPVGLRAYASPVGLTIERVAAPTAEIEELLTELDEALSGYSPEQRHALSLDQLFEDNVRFFEARLDGFPIGCGGVAFYEGFAEVKRMFTRPAARRKGVAAALLRRLEDEARGAGHSVLRLETGMYQEEAIGFYEREGFERCDAFGSYLGLSPQALATSVFYEKPL